MTKGREYTSNTHHYGLVEIVVERPVLNEEERAKAEERVKTALAQFGLEMAKKGAIRK